MPGTPVFVAFGRTASRCPRCGVLLNGVAGLSNSRTGLSAPRPGDLTICHVCTSWCAVTPTGLRLASDAEVAKLDPRLREVAERLAQTPLPGEPRH